MRVVDDEDLVDQHLIGELRKEYGMTYNDFFMVLTDVDLRVKVWVSVLNDTGLVLRIATLNFLSMNRLNIWIGTNYFIVGKFWNGSDIPCCPIEFVPRNAVYGKSWVGWPPVAQLFDSDQIQGQALIRHRLNSYDVPVPRDKRWRVFGFFLQKSQI